MNSPTVAGGLVSGLLLCASMVSPGWAATHYVDLNSPSPTAPYTTWGTAARNLQDAVDVASSNATILVADGIYRQAPTLTITNALMVRSVNGAEAAILDGGYPAVTNRCVMLSHSNAVLDGFTVRNGYDVDVGGGIFIERGGGSRAALSVTTRRWMAAGSGVKGA